MLAPDSRTTEDLGFDQVLVLLAKACHQPTARKRSEGLKPLSSPHALQQELVRTAEFHSIRTEGIPFPAIDFTEIERELHLLSIRDSVLSPEGFAAIAGVVALVNEMVEAIKHLDEAFPCLHENVMRAGPNSEIAPAIQKVFDNKWHVRDDASPELQSIRTALAAIRKQLAKNFSRLMKEYGGKGLLADTGESFLSDRKVLAVHSNHKRRIGGNVLGTSKTGSITFIEPEDNVALNIETGRLQEEERNEIRRILLQLTHQVGRHLPYLTSCQRLLTDLDFLQAKVRLALSMNAHCPVVVPDPEIVLRNAFHPLLLLQNNKAGRKTHPQDISMTPEARMLVISGPNAGGKSITLKTVGLLQLMCQSGLLIPASPESRLGFFHAILTDIGDHQSIENQLSTYSYRLKRMKYFLDTANRRSLVLLDEFGTGSDPDLGGALAEVFFEELYNKRCFGVITTHYSNIKLKAAKLRHAINGCMLFNRETLEPVYRLSVGEPGSSFTFEVAEINGIPVDLIQKAKSRLSEGKVKMDALLSSLQEEKTRLEQLTEQARQTSRSANQAISEYEKKREKYEDRLRRQQETIERNNKFLIHGKKLLQFIEKYHLRSANKELIEEIRKYLAMEKSAIEATRKEKNIKKDLDKEKVKALRRNKSAAVIKVGSLVRLRQTKQTGTVLELDGNQATVAFGNFKTLLDIAKIDWIR